MKLAARIVLVELAVALLLVGLMVGLGWAGKFGLSNAMAEIGLISPGSAGGILIPSTPMSIRLLNIVVWAGALGTVGAFAYIASLSFTVHAAGEKPDGAGRDSASTPDKPSGPPSRPAPGRP